MSYYSKETKLKQALSYFIWSLDLMTLDSKILKEYRDSKSVIVEAIIDRGKIHHSSMIQHLEYLFMPLYILE